MKKWRPRNFKSKEHFADVVYEYIDSKNATELPITIQDFCVYAWVHRCFLNDHDLKDWSELDYSDAIETLRTHAENDLHNKALLNKVNHRVAIFSLCNNFKWKERQDVTSNDKPISAWYSIVIHNPNV